MFRPSQPQEGKIANIGSVKLFSTTDAPPLAFRPLFSPKVDAAAAFSDPKGDHTSGNRPTQGDSIGGEGGEEGVEPRLANLDDASNADFGLHHPSSVVARDTDARRPSAIGRDSAATLLQSRFRGYRFRKGGDIGGGGRKETVTRSSPSGGETRHSVLDLEVRDVEIKIRRGIQRGPRYTYCMRNRLNLISEQQPRT